MKIEKAVLEGNGVRLEPLSASHSKGIAAAIRDGDLWKIPVTFVPHPDELDSFFESAESAFSDQKELAFATIGAIVKSGVQRIKRPSVFDRIFV